MCLCLRRKDISCACRSPLPRWTSPQWFLLCRLGRIFVKSVMRSKRPWKELSSLYFRCFSLDSLIPITITPATLGLMQRNVVYFMILFRYQCSLEKIYRIYSYRDSHTIFSYIHTYTYSLFIYISYYMHIYSHMYLYLLVLQ